MKTIRLPYGGAGMELSVPVDRLAATLEPQPVAAAANPVTDIEAALDSPIGTPALADLARGRKSACLLYTSPSPRDS